MVRCDAATKERPQLHIVSLCAGLFFTSYSVMTLLATTVMCVASLTAEQTAVRSEPESY